MQIRHSLLVAAGALSLTVALGACSREPSTPQPEAQTAAVEPPPVEEPFQVEATAGEEATVNNPDTTPNTPPADPATPDAPPAVPKDAPDNSNVKATSFRAYGNEPFWNVDIDGGMANYATLENQTGTMMQVKRSGEGNKVVYSGEHEGKPFSFTFVKRACSDSMSGRKFGFAVSAVVDGRTNTGCADSK